jgi:predicted phage terminase large subunit-like protein
MPEIELRPQAGPQERFLMTPADIAIYGGAAGGGKTWSLLLEPLRFATKNSGFQAVFFRRNTTQVRNPGGMWDESMSLYAGLADPKSQALAWVFPSGARVKFGHLDHETTVLDWQGAQIALIGFDELTHFTKSQFFYMLSRNRSMCGIKPYVRATTNPDADSWVAEFIEWWIDQETGDPIEERSGKVRWFIRVHDRMVWADSPEEIKAEYGDDAMPKSVTFIAASIFDNPALLNKDPGYLANLKALPLVERERLLGGNWKIRPKAGLYFRRDWCEVVDTLPMDVRMVRYWDLAATEKIEGNDPDWTVGIKLGMSKAGVLYVIHAVRMRVSPLNVKRTIKNTAQGDGHGTWVALPQDPGQAGKAQADDFVRELMGYTVMVRRESGDKITRFGPFSAQAQAGNVKFVRGPWNEEVFNSLESFPDAAHDDDADACAGAMNVLLECITAYAGSYRGKAA